MPKAAENSLRTGACREDTSGQKGVTLIELLVGLTVAAFVALAVVMAMYQILIGTARTTDQNYAVSQVRSTEYWMARDGRMAKPGNVLDCLDLGGTSLLQILVWTDESGTATNTITYTLEGGTIWREIDGQRTFVADNILPKEVDVTWCAWDDSARELTVTATAGVHGVTETRQFVVRARPDPVAAT